MPGPGLGGRAWRSESRGDHQGEPCGVETCECLSVAVRRAFGDLCPLGGVVGAEAGHVREEVLEATVVREREREHGQAVGGGVGQHEHGVDLSVWFDLVTTVYRPLGGRVKLTACEPRHIWLFGKLVSRARIEPATLYRQSHSSGPRHALTLILLTERKVSVCSHPSRHRQTVNAANVHGNVQALPLCVIQFTKIVHAKLLARAVSAVLGWSVRAFPW